MMIRHTPLSSKLNTSRGADFGGSRSSGALSHRAHFYLIAARVMAVDDAPKHITAAIRRHISCVDSTRWAGDRHEIRSLRSREYAGTERRHYASAERYKRRTISAEMRA